MKNERKIERDGFCRKVGLANMALAAAVLSGLNPLVVLMVVAAWKLFTRAKFMPKGCKVHPEARNDNMYYSTVFTRPSKCAVAPLSNINKWSATAFDAAK